MLIHFIRIDTSNYNDFIHLEDKLQFLQFQLVGLQKKKLIDIVLFPALAKTALFACAVHVWLAPKFNFINIINNVYARNGGYVAKVGAKA